MAWPTRPSRRGWRLATLAVVLALGVTTGCSGGVGAQGQSPGGVGGSESTSGPLLVMSHAPDATNVSPADPVTVAITGGTLETVTLANQAGKIVKGDFDAARENWKSSEVLGYNKRYILTAIGVGADRKRLEATRAFTTVKPQNFTLAYLRANVGTLLDGGTFGVGQPIVVWFDEVVNDRAAAERALTVTTDPPVVGAWHWMDSREVHWRPREYWPAGTKVKVDANVYGKDLGGGLYGQEDRTASFTIGRSKIAIADSKTFRMKVYLDGQLVTRINGRDVTTGIPISMGKNSTERAVNGSIIDFRTNSGPHVVTLKYEAYRMTSASFGITNPKSPNFYDIVIKKSMRISTDGEFVHLADWNIPQHGKANTSHGCINVAPTYIYWFYDTFGAGDIVDVRNTGKNLDVRDGLGDWVLSWDEWQKGSALA